MHYQLKIVIMKTDYIIIIILEPFYFKKIF